MVGMEAVGDGKWHVLRKGREGRGSGAIERLNRVAVSGVNWFSTEGVADVQLVQN